MSRRLYRWNPETKVLEELGADWRDPGRDQGHKSEEEVYGHTTATDGTDLSTRRRHREYMQRNGLTIADDYKETWAKAKAERVKSLTPGAGYDSATRREQLGRIAYELETKKRGKR